MTATIVLVTHPDLEEAQKLGKTLVERHLVACSNTLPNLSSAYRWDGQVQQEQECLMILKTQSHRIDELEKTIQDLHPYETPAFVVVEATRVAKSYGEWLEESCRQED